MDSYVDSVIGFATLMKRMKLTNVLKRVFCDDGTDEDYCEAVSFFLIL